MPFTTEDTIALSVLKKLDLPKYKLQWIMAKPDYLDNVHSKELVDFLLAINQFYLIQDNLNLSAYNLKHLQRIVRERLDLEKSGCCLIMICKFENLEHHIVVFFPRIASSDLLLILK